MGKNSNAGPSKKISSLNPEGQTLIKQLIDEAVTSLKNEYDHEIKELKAELIEVKNSQDFLSNKYEELKLQYGNLSKINKQQEQEIINLKCESTDLKNKGIKEADKLDALEQYGRRQNLEIAGIPMIDSEDTNALVIEVAKLLDVRISSDEISTSHRLMPSSRRKLDDEKQPPVIIVRFISRNIRNQLYSRRKMIKNLNLKNFSVPGTKRIFINENLTYSRKRLFWKAKEMAKEQNYRFFWTSNGNIFVKKAVDSDTIAIRNELDLKLIN